MKYKAYIIVFDRKEGVDFKAFHEKLVALPEVQTWWHYIKSAYIIISDKQSANDLIKILLPFTPVKLLLITEINLKNRNGLLTEKGWAWCRDKVIEYNL